MVEVVGWAGHLKCHLIMAGAKRGRERGVSHAHMFPTDTWLMGTLYRRTRTMGRHARTRLNLDTQYASSCNRLSSLYIIYRSSYTFNDNRGKFFSILF